MLWHIVNPKRKSARGNVCWGQWHVHLSTRRAHCEGEEENDDDMRSDLTKLQTVTCCLHDHGTERSGYRRQPHQEERNQKSSRNNSEKKEEPREAKQQKWHCQNKEKSLLLWTTQNTYIVVLLPWSHSFSECSHVNLNLNTVNVLYTYIQCTVHSKLVSWLHRSVTLGQAAFAPKYKDQSKCLLQ